MTTQISSDNIQPSTLEAIGAGPKITTIQVANSTYVATGGSTISTTGGYAIINGSNFLSNVNVIIGNALASTVIFVSSIRINIQVPALAVGNYIVYVTNTDNGAVAVKPNGIIIA
jgi:hypothetical protein